MRESLRREIRERDGGICRLCGIDVGLVERVRERVRELDRAHSVDWRDRNHRGKFYERLLGWKPGAKSYAEIDHVYPRECGGGDEPENLRLLCPKCHGLETANFAGLRAARRKASLRAVAKVCCSAGPGRLVMSRPTSPAAALLRSRVPRK